MLRFEYPILLYALAAVALLALLFAGVLRWKGKVRKKIGDEMLVKALLSNYSGRNFMLKGVFAIGALALVVIAMANLRKPTGNEKVTRNGIDIMIALDVSRSMLAEDIKPNRLERAKQMLGKLIDRLKNDRIGIVVFAGKAYLQMPLTADHGAARLFLSSANTDMVPSQGTVIGEALQMCGSFFPDKEKKYKAIVLISDGEDHDEKAGDAATSLADRGISINTVGIGSPEGAPIIDQLTKQMKRDNEGNTIVSKLNEEELKGIAKKGNGIYLRYTGTDEAADKIEAQLNSMDKRSVTDFAGGSFYSFLPWLLGAALVLLLAELFLSENKRRVMRTAAAGFFLFFAMPLTSLAQDKNNEALKKGNEAYEKQAYDKAAEVYKGVTDKQPGNVAAQYNLGNALYKSSQGEAAIAAYDKALEAAKTPADKARILYNKGVVQQNSKQLPEAIGSYKQALKLNPSDADTRLNLQKALQQQKQQEEQDKKDKKDKDQKQKQPKDDPKKDKPDNKDKQKEEQPQPQPSRISKKDAEEKLKALLQQEKNLQEKLRRTNVSTVKKDKDW